MSNTQMVEERRRGGSETTATPGVDGGTRPGTGTLTHPTTHATVLPAPLTTIIAVLAGGLLGVAAVYGVASRLAGSLTAVAAIVMVFAVTLAGPRVHAAARTELGRTIAVTLQAIGFGGVVGALVIAA
ncbi:hypothetical protein [Dietzia kunjamensis]|uniref:hypothetical protein n=1 Tax=Dietzia kunjamensis TaxID=322509 RepID=UPI0033667AF3